MQGFANPVARQVRAKGQVGDIHSVERTGERVGRGTFGAGAVDILDPRRYADHIGQQHPFLTAGIGGVADLCEEIDDHLQFVGGWLKVCHKIVDAADNGEEGRSEAGLGLWPHAQGEVLKDRMRMFFRRSSVHRPTGLPSHWTRVDRF